MTLTIVVSLPSKDLSPNARVYWRRKSEAVKLARQEAKLKAESAMNELNWRKPPRWKSATVAIHWYARTRHKTDSDNMLASCKAVFDGLEDAGIVENDRQMTYLPPVKHVDAKNPRLEIDVTGGDE